MSNLAEQEHRLSSFACRRGSASAEATNQRYGRMWQSSRRVLMDRFHHEAEKAELMDAACCLLYRGREPEQPEISVARLAYIPYHCGKPLEAYPAPAQLRH